MKAYGYWGIAPCFPGLGINLQVSGQYDAPAALPEVK
jgi:hypothetical protein